MATPKKPARSASPTTARLRQLYRRLSDAGFDRSFVRRFVLPPAWQDERSGNDADYRDLLTFLSDHLGITADSLENSEVPLEFVGSRARLFRGRDLFESADPAQQVAWGVARIALSGLPAGGPAGAPPTPVPPALVLRDQILRQGRSWVGFRDLLAYCWRIGVPVLHVQHLPAKSSKHRGVAAEVGGHSAIVLCQQSTSPAWHLTALAHEMGHLTEEDARLFARPGTTEEQIGVVEQAEAAAGRYATHLITGGRDLAPDVRQYRRLQDLVDATYERANEMNVDPGYLIIRRGTILKQWVEVAGALRIIDEREGGASASDLVNSEVLSHIDTRRIGREGLSFFQRVTGAPLPRTPEPPAPRTVSPPSARTAADIRAVEAILKRLLRPEAVASWFDKELPSLGGRKPMDVIRSGGTEQILEMLNQVEGGIHI